ncbi:MAG: LamG-like jellyroll fold domain-containing protein [Specibacter sp.]
MIKRLGAGIRDGANYVKLPLVSGQTDAAASFSYDFWMSERSRSRYGPVVCNQNFAVCNNKALSLYNQTTEGVLDACWGQTSGGTRQYVKGFSGNGAYVNSPSGSNKGVNFFKLPLIEGRTDASSSFSSVFWLKEAATGSGSPLVSNQDFAYCYNKGTTLYNTAGSPGIQGACFGQNGASTAQNYLANVSTSSVIGAWHQVAVVADRTAGPMTTYVDGQQTARSTSLASAFNLKSGFPFTVGAEGYGTDTLDGFVNATIDNFDFYNVPVSAAQIQNQYAAAKAGVGTTNTGSTLDTGFVSSLFRAPQVRAGGAVAQPVAGLWNGKPVTSYTEVAGDDWLRVGPDGTVSGTAPARHSHVEPVGCRHARERFHLQEPGSDCQERPGRDRRPAGRRHRGDPAGPSAGLARRRRRRRGWHHLRLPA